MDSNPHTSTLHATVGPGSQTSGTTYKRVILGLTRDTNEVVGIRFIDNMDYRDKFTEVGIQYIPARRDDEYEKDYPECIKVMRAKLNSALRATDQSTEILCTLAINDEENPNDPDSELPEIWVQYASTTNPWTGEIIDKHIELAMGKDTRVRVFDIGTTDPSRKITFQMFARYPITGDPVRGAAQEDHEGTYRVTARHARELGNGMFEM